MSDLRICPKDQVAYHVDYLDQLDDDIKEVVRHLRNKRSRHDVPESHSILLPPDITQAIMLRSAHSFRIRERMDKMNDIQNNKIKQGQFYRHPLHKHGQPLASALLNSHQEQCEENPGKNRLENMLQLAALALGGVCLAPTAFPEQSPIVVDSNVAVVQKEEEEEKKFLKESEVSDDESLLSFLTQQADLMGGGQGMGSFVKVTSWIEPHKTNDGDCSAATDLSTLTP